MGERIVERKRLDITPEQAAQFLQGTPCPDPNCLGQMTTYTTFEGRNKIVRSSCYSCGTAANLNSLEISAAFEPRKI